jgi:L-rhamnose mutarotase
MDCPLHEEGREEMLSGAGTRNYSILMNEPKGIKASVKWVMSKRLLAQFSYAQDMEEEREEEHQATWQEGQNELNPEGSETDEQTNGEQEALGSEEEESEEEM